VLLIITSLKTILIVINLLFIEKNKIPLEYYKKFHTEILNLQNKNFSKLAHNIVAVDGTYNNNKKLETSLNMSYYDVTNEIPIELTFKILQK